MRSQKKAPPIERSLICASDIELRSAAEEQPQQNDHRDRHAQQPKQNSSSHVRLLNSSLSQATTRREGRDGSGRSRKAPTSVRCSASTTTARPAASARPSAAARSSADRASARRPFAVARRPVDGDADLHQLVAGRIDVVDLVGEMAEIAVLAVFLLVPIVGELDQRRAARLGQLLQQCSRPRARTGTPA